MIVSQSASRAEADSDDDSKLSLTVFREGSDRTIIFWPNLALYKSNKSNTRQVSGTQLKTLYKGSLYKGPPKLPIEQATRFSQENTA